MDQGKKGTFKDIVQQERLRRGWSQSDLAEKVGVTTLTVHRWENGKNLPQSFPRQRLCELFEKTPEALGLLREVQEETNSEAYLPPPSSKNVGQLSDSNTPFSLKIIKERRLSRRTVIAGAVTSGLAAISGGLIWWIHSPHNLLYVYHGHSDLVTSVAWSPDGKRIASGSYDRTVQVWDALSGNHVLIYPDQNDIITSVHWSPSARYIVSGADHSVQVWNPANGSHIWTFPLYGPVSWSSDSTRLIGQGANFTMQAWSVLDQTHILNYSGPINGVFSASWSPDGAYIAAGSADSTVWIWNAANAKPLLIYRGHASRVEAVAWSPDSKYVVSGGDDGYVHVWDVKDGNTLLSYEYFDSVRAVAWSPNGKYIAWGGTRGTIQILNTTNGGLLLIYRGLPGIIRGIAWSPNSNLIACCGDSTVQVLKLI